MNLELLQSEAGFDFVSKTFFYKTLTGKYWTLKIIRIKDMQNGLTNFTIDLWNYLWSKSIGTLVSVTCGTIDSLRNGLTVSEFSSKRHLRVLEFVAAIKIAHRANDRFVRSSYVSLISVQMFMLRHKIKSVTYRQ
jgi:hypothetical protein